jgi:hypothetical protein
MSMILERKVYLEDISFLEFKCNLTGEYNPDNIVMYIHLSSVCNENFTLQIQLQNQNRKPLKTIKYKLNPSYLYTIKLDREYIDIYNDLISLLDSINPFEIYCSTSLETNVFRIDFSTLGTLISIYNSNMSYKYMKVYENEEYECDQFSDKENLTWVLENKPDLNIKNYLESLIYYTINSTIQKIVTDNQCPVLLEPLKQNNICIMPCNHILSKSAFSKLKVESKTLEHGSLCEKASQSIKKCPLCRYELDILNDLKKCYFV